VIGAVLPVALVGRRAALTIAAFGMILMSLTYRARRQPGTHDEPDPANAAARCRR
jgi:hypothetical protein